MSIISLIYALISGVLIYLSAVAFSGFWDIKRENPFDEGSALLVLTLGLLALTASNVFVWVGIGKL